MVITGLIVAVWGSVALALVCYYADPLLRTPQDLQQLGLPLTGVVLEPQSSVEIAV